MIMLEYSNKLENQSIYVINGEDELKSLISRNLHIIIIKIICSWI